MREYNSVEDFKKDTSENPLKFRFYSDEQEVAYKSLKKILEENITKKVPISRRFSMIIYGSSGISKSFIMKRVLKELESEGKITTEDYLYCENFREEIIKEHDRLRYKYYNIGTINNLIESILKEYLYEKDLKLVIFDNLKEKQFLDIDFTASNFEYNSNGKGVIWILSFREGFLSKINESVIELLEIPDNKRSELLKIKDRHFRGSEVNIGPDIKNLNDLLKYLGKRN